MYWEDYIEGTLSVAMKLNSVDSTTFLMVRNGSTVLKMKEFVISAQYTKVQGQIRGLPNYGLKHISFQKIRKSRKSKEFKL